jgi:FkbM family methyltransferase
MHVPDVSHYRLMKDRWLPVILSLTRRYPRNESLTPLALLPLFAYMVRCSVMIPKHRKHRALVRTTVLDSIMNLDPLDYVDCYYLLFPHLWDQHEVAHLREMLRPGDVFLDIGSHVGFYTLLAAKAVGDRGKVLAIEAEPETHARLRMNIASNRLSNVIAVNIGVSDRRETLRLAEGWRPFRSCASFLWNEETIENRLQAALLGSSVPVQCAPLMEIVRDHGIDRIDGMKIDIEGFEFRVLSAFLRDAERALWPRFIILEFHPRLVKYAGGSSLALLEKHGYQVYKKTIANYILVRHPR